MIGVGRPPASTMRSRHFSWSSTGEAQATWCTVPAPGSGAASVARYLGVLRDQRLLAARVDEQLMLETLRIVKEERLPLALDAQPLGPEVERVLRADAPEDPVHHAGARMSLGRARVFEEGDIAPRAAALVGVEEVVDGRVVLVDGLLDEAQPELVRVEVDVRRCVAGDRRDVVDAFEFHTAPND